VGEVRRSEGGRERWWKETQEEVVKAARTSSPLDRSRGSGRSAPPARANPVGAGGQGSRRHLTEAGNSGYSLPNTAIKEGMQLN